MTKERELLELAAKAMDFIIMEDACCSPEYVWAYPRNAKQTADGDHEGQFRWAPLHDQADSANLRDALGIDVVYGIGAVYALIPVQTKTTAIKHDGTREDRSRAVREAVVMVAAEIGRSMK